MAAEVSKNKSNLLEASMEISADLTSSGGEENRLLSMDYYIEQAESLEHGRAPINMGVREINPDMNSKCGVRKNIGEFCEGMSNIKAMVENWKRERDNGGGVLKKTVFISTPDPQKKQRNQNFCTLCGREYLLKVVSLYNSLDRCSKNFHIWICCIDEDVYPTLMKLGLRNATLFKVQELENGELLEVKRQRKKNEYCWTLKSFLVEHVLKHYNLEEVMYCDSDLYFFSEPSSIFESFEGHSVMLCTNRFMVGSDSLYGKYQAGFIGFRKDETGIESLRWWREKCMDWCYDRPDTINERCGDQKYLDEIPLRFDRVKILDEIGVNAAPWNSIYDGEHRIYSRDGGIFIDENRLVMWHFACTILFNENEFDLWYPFEIEIKKEVIDKIYIPYLEELGNALDLIKECCGGEELSLFSSKEISRSKNYYRYERIKTLPAKVKVEPLKPKVESIKNDVEPQELKFESVSQGGKRNICTIVEANSLIKGLGLYNSLIRHMGDFHLWVCCADELSYTTLLKMPLERLTPVPINQIEGFCELKHKAKAKDREYIHGIKASLMLNILKKQGTEAVVYCDTNLFFFSNPEPFFEEWEDNSIIMLRRRGEMEFGSLGDFYKAGIVGVKNVQSSINALTWLFQRSKEWNDTNTEIQMESWIDQRYGKEYPLGSSEIRIIDNPGVYASPWSVIKNPRIGVRSKGRDIFILDSRLIAYNFEGLLILDESEFDLWRVEPLTIEDNILRFVYIPYLRDIKNAIEELKERGCFNPSLLNRCARDGKIMNNVKF